MSDILHGMYGYYYPYTDDSGKTKGLQILDWVYNKYCQPGYLTSQHIEDMLNGKSVTFFVPNRGSGGGTNVTAKVVPYTNKAGKQTRIIAFDTDKIDDRKIILANAEKIAVSYWDANSTRFDFKRPQLTVNELELTQEWKTWATSEWIQNKRYGTIKVYRPRARKDDSVLIYCEVDVNTNSCEMITEEQYKAVMAAKEEADQLAREEWQKKQKIANGIKEVLFNYTNDIAEQLYGCSTSEMINIIEENTKEVNLPNIESLVAGLLNGKTPGYLKKIFTDTQNEIQSKITPGNDELEETAIEIKESFLRKLKIYGEYKKIKSVRQDLWQQVEQNGLESVVDSVVVDEALDIGKFREVQKVLVKYKNNAVKAIIFYMYTDIIDPVILKENLLNLLKIYYDFYDMPEKDRKAIAKFIAKHRLSDYYDKISQFDDVIETLIDESRDPKLLKPILNSIAGTPRANALKEKTYYFEKRARLRDDIVVFKPIELLDKLRAYIKEFNVSSNVAILTNIELDADESFIFQFYTFSDDNSGEDFDGRRIQYMTKIYNMHNPDKKIGFNYN